MNKIGANFGQQPFSKSEKPSATSPAQRAFSDLLATADTAEFAGLITTTPDQETAFGEKGEAFDDGLGDILGNFESSPTDSDHRSPPPNSSRNNNRAKPRPTTRRPESSNTVAADEARRAQLRYRGIGEREESLFEQQSSDSGPTKLKDPLAPFTLPIVVDRFPIPNFLPVEKPTAASVVRPEMLEQIVQEVRLGINETGAAEFQFDLKSDVLDGLKLKISAQDGQIYATFIAENIHVKETLDQSASDLIQALQDRGLAVANLQVAVGSDAGGSGGGNNSNAGQSFAGQSGFGDEGNFQQQSSASDYRSHSEPESNQAVDQGYTTRSTTDYTI